MGKGIIHSDATKIRCAYLYASLGNYSEVARQTKINRKSIMNWAKDSDVWHEALDKARQEISDELLALNLENARLSGIELTDRIKNGDTKLTAKGAVKVPMTGKDLAVVNGIQIDKGRTSMGLATSIKSDTSTTTQSVLTFLGQIHDEYAKQQARQASSIDGECTEVTET